MNVVSSFRKYLNRKLSWRNFANCALKANSIIIYHNNLENKNGYWQKWVFFIGLVYCSRGLARLSWSRKPCYCSGTFFFRFNNQEMFPKKKIAFPILFGLKIHSRAVRQKYMIQEFYFLISPSSVTSNKLLADLTLRWKVLLFQFCCCCWQRILLFCSQH